MPTCCVAPDLATFKSPWLPLEILSSQGLGTGQREQSKPDGLD